MTQLIITQELQNAKNEEAWYLNTQVPTIVDEAKVQIQLALLALGDSPLGRPIVTRITPQHPVVLHQIQNIVNYLHLALRHVESSASPTGSVQAIEYFGDLLGLIKKAECIFTPDHSAGIQYPVKDLDPPLPDDLVLELYINRVSVTTRVHVLDDLNSSSSSSTTKPIGHLFPVLGKSASAKSSLADAHLLCPGTLHQASLETIYPYLETAQTALGKVGFLARDVLTKLNLFRGIDEEIQDFLSYA
ncbi:hypothetical protein H4R33_000336 [Dimargaris cristalligena]|nr:hypothetical protein H4R33_000336 [Dimargaris cristalligena]